MPLGLILHYPSRYGVVGPPYGGHCCIPGNLIIALGLGLTVRLQCDYSAITVRLQCDYSAITVRLQYDYGGLSVTLIEGSGAGGAVLVVCSDNL